METKKKTKNNDNRKKTEIIEGQTPQGVTGRSYLHPLEDPKVDVTVAFEVGVDAGTQNTFRVEWSLQACHDPLISQLLQGGLQPHLQLFGGGEKGVMEATL